jgi:hypothetical protein
MISAGTAGFQYLSAKGLSCPMDTDRRILRSDPCLPGQLVEIALLQVHDS